MDRTEHLVELAEVSVATRVVTDLLRVSEREGRSTVNLPVTVVRLLATYIDRHSPGDRMVPVIDSLDPDKGILVHPEGVLLFKHSWVRSMMESAAEAATSHGIEVETDQERLDRTRP